MYIWTKVCPVSEQISSPCRITRTTTCARDFTILVKKQLVKFAILYFLYISSLYTAVILFIYNFTLHCQFMFMFVCQSICLSVHQLICQCVCLFYCYALVIIQLEIKVPFQTAIFVYESSIYIYTIQGEPKYTLSVHTFTQLTIQGEPKFTQSVDTFQQ